MNKIGLELVPSSKYTISDLVEFNGFNMHIIRACGHPTFGRGGS
jgi:hypothetical protein